MRSNARLTYTEVAAYLAQPAKPFAKNPALGEPLRNLYDVFQALYKARQLRGALDFDAPEMKARFDEHGRIATFVEQARNDAHRLIEECMIAANVQAARFLKKHKIPTLYRVHGQPEADRLDQLREFLKGFAIELPVGRPLTPEDLSAVLEQAAGKEEGHLIETVVGAHAAAGGVPAGEHRPLRAVAHGVCALHVADPPVSRPDRAPGHPACAAQRHGGSIACVALGDGCLRPAMLLQGAPCGRGHARCDVVAQVRVHAGQDRRGVRGAGHRSRGFRVVRAGGGRADRRADPCQRARLGLLQPRQVRLPDGG